LAALWFGIELNRCQVVGGGTRIRKWQLPRSGFVQCYDLLQATWEDFCNFYKENQAPADELLSKLDKSSYQQVKAQLLFNNLSSEFLFK